MMLIQQEDPGSDDVHALLLEHLADMRNHSPPESVHALDMEALRAPAVTFWTVRENGELLGCGALKKLDADSAELKSMKTANAHTRRGVARALLNHIKTVATEQNLKFILLETGTPEPFIAARNLYERFGFTECEPFAEYTEDPYSVFMRYNL